MSFRHQHRKRRPLFSHVQAREIGDRVCTGDSNRNFSSLNSNFKATYTWDPTKTSSCHHGGIFNLDFSPNGALLAAACEGHSVLMFDPFSHKLVTELNKAHDDCVNCVRFLDSRLLATCSDDNNVALWDIRYLKTKLHLLSGHTNWVKNIEYAWDCGKLVTSGFDGNIFTWDINSYCDGKIEGQKVFSHKMLMRSKLSPDCSKLLVSTQEGRLIMISNLDLNNLGEDMKDFQPHRFLTRQPKTNNPLERRRNNFEIINDWPLGNGAGDIASIQIHPQGWCVLSRNVSRDCKSEWTCVHDIQDYDSEPDDDNSEAQSDPHHSEVERSLTPPPISIPTSSANAPLTHQNIVPYVLLTSALDSPLSPDSNTSSEDIFGAAEEAAEDVSNGNVFSTEERQTLANGYHPRRINVNGDLPNGLNNGHVSDSDSTDDSSSDEMFSNNLSIFSSRSLEILSMIGAYEFENGEMPLTFHRRLYSRFSLGQHERKRERLLYFVDEPNVGRGFIKELCFSSDGRLVCSPFKYGVRLLAFDPECSELCDLISPGPVTPMKMYEVQTCISHTSNVVTCKFSPQHCIFVSGCLSGKIAFHQPVL